MVVIRLFVFSLCSFEVFTSKTCGVARTKSNVVYEGISSIENFPWIGFLYYAWGEDKYTTAVVLVSQQAVLASASEIETIPKDSFRAEARIVLGQNCSGETIRIRQYTYHPEYSHGKLVNALALIQLETDSISSSYELRPICAPPTYYNNPIFYAIVPSDECYTSKIMIYKMTYVPLDQCQKFYRRARLDIESIWPSHPVCAKSIVGGTCIWRSGAILTVKAANKWRLLGFGTYGPGCQAPARFLDFNVYYKWVHQSLSRIGRPALTKISDNHFVLRRMQANIQKFGQCEYEETLIELYTDTEQVDSTYTKRNIYKYNMSLFENVEYSCIIFKVTPIVSSESLPIIRLRRWCPGNYKFCSGFGLISIHFYVEIQFKETVKFTLQVYGTQIWQMDIKSVIHTLNSKLPVSFIRSFTEAKDFINRTEFTINPWFNP